MDATVALTFACAVLAAACTGVLVARCIRAPRIDIIAWTCAVAAIAVSLGAQSLGAYHGYTSGTFRAVQVGAQLIAPLWLAWGLVELGGRSISARFGAKLVTAALTVIGAVVLITDPLAGTPFRKSWPPGPVHYQIIPRSLLSLIAGVTVATVLVMLVVGAVRLRRDPDWRLPVIALAAAGVAAVAILGLRLSWPANLAYPALCAVCAVLASFGGIAADKVGLEELHGEIPADRGAQPVVDQPGDHAGDLTFGSGEPGRLSSRPENGGARGSRADRRFPDEDWYRLDRGRRTNGGYPPGGQYQPDGGLDMKGLDNGAPSDSSGEDDQEGDAHAANGGHQPDDVAYGLSGAGLPGAGLPGPGVSGAGVSGAGVSGADRTEPWQPRTLGRGGAVGRDEPAQASPEAGVAGAADHAVTQRLFGLIAIYTLAEGRADEFDALAERVVDEVRAHEPDALVYAVHSVPNAPMQRIFYEVYRDQTAYEEHKRHSYIQRFDAERAPFVLAINVIELGTQQAKVTPLPGLTQLFGHTPGE